MARLSQRSEDLTGDLADRLAPLAIDSLAYPIDKDFSGHVDLSGTTHAASVAPYDRCLRLLQDLFELEQVRQS